MIASQGSQHEKPTNPSTGIVSGAASVFGHCPTRADIAWGYVGLRLGLAYALNKKMVVQAGAFLVFLDGGAYEFGSSNISANMGNVLFGQFSRQSNGGNAPGCGSWDANVMQKPPAVALILPWQTAEISGTSIETVELPLTIRLEPQRPA